MLGLEVLRQHLRILIYPGSDPLLFIHFFTFIDLCGFYIMHSDPTYFPGSLNLPSTLAPSPQIRTKFKRQAKNQTKQKEEEKKEKKER